MASNTAPTLRRVQRPRRRHAELPRARACRSARAAAPSSSTSSRPTATTSPRSSPMFEGNMGQANDPFGQIQGERLAVTIDGQQVQAVRLGQGDARARPRSGVPTPPIKREGGPAPRGRDVPRQQLRARLPTSTTCSSARRSKPAASPATFSSRTSARCKIEGPFNASARVATRRAARRSSSAGPRQARRPRRKTACARNDPVHAGPQGLPPAGDGRPTWTTLMEFYASGRKAGTFDDGIEKGLRRLLADPEVRLPVSRSPRRPCAPAARYRISDLALASRLSFFIWSTMPDEELLTLAQQGTPAPARRARAAGAPDGGGSEVGGAHRELRRAVAEPAGARHACSRTPRPIRTSTTTCASAFRTEVEMLFDSIVREDRSVLDLLTADYTFVDQRLAKHYGIPNVYGSRFRRVDAGPRNGRAARAARQGRPAGHRRRRPRAPRRSRAARSSWRRSSVSARRPAAERADDQGAGDRTTRATRRSRPCANRW